MTGGRRLGVVVVGALLAVSVALGVGWLAWGEDLSYRHTLVKYDGGAESEPNRYVNLGDGEAQFSIGSPDKRRIVVQWRDPDGHGWTAPETVWTEKSAKAVENDVRFAAGTVAVRQYYDAAVDPDADDDGEVFPIGIVCRERSCTASDAPWLGGEVQVTPDGATAFLGENDLGPLLWTAEQGLRQEIWEGHPGYSFALPSATPLLAPDGSLRVVTSKRSRDGGCTFDLLSSGPGGASLTQVGRSEQPALPGRSKASCRPDIDSSSADWVGVTATARAFWFIRDGAAWVTTDEDPSGLEKVEAGGGCCDTLVSGLHWNEVAHGSPDGGHRIQVQTRRHDQETWSEPQILDAAPVGTRCDYLEGDQLRVGYVLILECDASDRERDESDAGARAPWRRSFALAVSVDLEYWDTAFVSDARDYPELADGRMTLGNTTWTPEKGFVTR